MVDIPRREWRELKDAIDNGKYDNPNPLWSHIEQKFRREAIYGEKWRTKDNFRIIE